MLFNSVQFLLFFVFVTLLYFLLKHKYRWMLLLAASCYFYMAFVPVYILILGFTILIDYFAGIYIEKLEGKKKRIFLILSIVANLGILAVFKYYNFLNDNLGFLLNGISIENHIPYLSILLPIGLSFHTFQAMSYTIEVYRGNQKAERHFGIYSLYVMFYPQLVAGPIERPQNLLHQFREKKSFNCEKIIEGLKLMLWGFFVKVVIADRLALYVDAVYNNPEQHGGKTLAVATIFFALQIYCDFAGYSNIAIGAAKVMGFDLMTNFRQPYFSKSISEFWSRWHISLSTWFKDYLYISLGGNRVSLQRLYLNLLLVFVISGLWHGANWTFIIWGAINGFYLIFALITLTWRQKLSMFFRMHRIPVFNNIFQTLLTFALICFAWIFFRANNANDAFFIVKKIGQFSGELYIDSPSTIIFALFGILFLFLMEWKMEFFTTRFRFEKKHPFLANNLFYATILLFILLIGVFDGGQFIYFQF